MTWSFDLITAPRDADLWLATKCGKVIKSHWHDKFGSGRWVGLATREEPVAWMAYVVPQHPFEIHESPSTNDKACSKAVPQDKPSPAGIGSELPAGREGRHEGEAASADLPANLIVHRHIFLDDAGSGQ